jgi:peptidoglycan/LPS O-acetylase OafA/YrhL
MILGLYVCTPVLCRFVRSVSRPWRVISVMVLMFLSMVWPLVQRHYFPSYQYSILTLFIPFTGYYLLGYELMNVRVEGNRALRFLAIFLVAAVFLMCLSFLSVRKTVTVMPVWWLHGAFSPLVVVMSVSLFHFFHSVGNEFSSVIQPSIVIRRFTAIVQKLAPLTLGIYVIHPLLIRLLTHIGLIDAYEWGGVSLAVVVLVVFLWSAMTVWAISEIPYIRVLVTGRR